MEKSGFLCICREELWFPHVPFHLIFCICAGISAQDRGMSICGLEMHLLASVNIEIIEVNVGWPYLSYNLLITDLLQKVLGAACKGHIVKPEPTSCTLAAWFVIAQSCLCCPSNRISWNLRMLGVKYSLLTSSCSRKTSPDSPCGLQPFTLSLCVVASNFPLHKILVVHCGPIKSVGWWGLRLSFGD